MSGKVIAGALVVVLAASGALVYRNRTASSSTVADYVAAKPQHANITNMVTGTGPIAASQAVPLNFKSSGKVAEIDVKVGDKVTSGQTLAKLDNSDLKTQLQQAQASLANAQAAYNKLVQGPLPTDVAAAQAAINSATSQVADAQKSLGGAQASAAKDIAADQQSLADAQKSLKSVQDQITASTASDKVAVTNAQQSVQTVQQQVDAATAADKVAVANAQQALVDAQKNAQNTPAVIAQQIATAKNNLYSAQITRNGNCNPTKPQFQCDSSNASVNAAQTSLDQANAQALQTQQQAQTQVNQAQSSLKTADSTLQNDLAKQQGNVQTAQGQLNTANASLQNDLAKFQGNLQTAQGQVNQAQATLASAQTKDAQSIQSAQAQVDSAAASVQSAQAAYNQKVAPPTQADIDAAQAQMAGQQAGVALAQSNVDAAVLKAPTDGTVTGINGAIGQWLSGGATSGAAANSASGASTSNTSSDFISLTSLSGLQVSAQVNEADIGKVKVGEPVNFTVDAFPGRTFTGKVAIIQPLGQTVQNVVSYTVTSSIDQTNVSLLPGMTASLNIITDQAKNALEVPMAALTYARTHVTASAGQRGQGAGQRGQGAGQGQAGQAGAQGGANAAARGAASGQGGQARQGGQGAGGQARSAAGGSGSAAFEQPGGPGVLYVLNNGKTSPVRVQFGISDGRFVQILSGLDENAQVVTGGGPAVAAPKATQQGGRGPANPFGPAGRGG